MNPIQLIGFVVVIFSFILLLYILFAKNPPTFLVNMMDKWKLAIVIFSISLLFYILFSSLSYASLNYQQTITDGVDTFVYTNNEYLTNISLMQVATAVQTLSFVISLSIIVSDLFPFIKGKFKRKTNWVK